MSVVVPVFNGERFLGEALQSVSAQRGVTTEVIVVDDGSTDGSAVIARSFPGATYLYQRNAGSPAARNVGVLAATGDFLAFLDADDLYQPDKLAFQLDALQTDPTVGCVLGRQEVFADDGVDASWLEETPAWMRWAPDWERRGQIQPMSMMVSRSTFDRVGLFDERLRVSDDVDWVLRAMESGVTMRVLDRVVLRRRAHAGNISRDLDARRHDHFLLLKARMDRRRAAPCG